MSGHRNEKGMTLVEIIIAIALLGIIAIGFLSIYVTGMRMTRVAGDRTKNVANAETVVEQVVAGSDVTAGTSPNTVVVNGTVIANASITTTGSVELSITFDGMSTDKKVMVTKTEIEKNESTIDGRTLSTVIEVYK